MSHSFVSNAKSVWIKWQVWTQFPKRGILNQFPGLRLVYLDNYAGHMRNFTGSVDCWGFLGGEGWRQGQTILLRKNNDERGAGGLAWENAVLIKTIHLIATLKKWGVTVSLK